jgi:predicted amidohydrolase YtcJ
MDADEGWATALAISKGRIVAVGTDGEIVPLANKGCRIINLNGRVVLPGFNDCHCHLLGMGLVLSQVDIAPDRASDIPSLLNLFRNHGASGDKWIQGRGYDQNRMAERRHPTRQELDTANSDRPIVATHASGHAMAVNSAALHLASIVKNTPDPPGGTIERDPQTGEPTGLLLENAMGLIHKALPKKSQADLVGALGLASRHLAAMGITTASEASAYPEDLPAFFKAAKSGALTIRCHPFLLAHKLRDGARFPTPDEVCQTCHPNVHVGTAKIYTDGALSTRTAYLREPFIDNLQNCGTPIWSREELGSLVQGAHDAGWQIAAHAIGDAAIDLCLRAYQEALFRSPGLPMRHRIEHAMLLWEDQIGRMASLGLVPVFQPQFIAHFGDAYIAALGEERADRLMPYRSVIQSAGQLLAFSSDLPVVPGKPLDGVRAAVERKTPHGRTLGTTERVTPYEALRAYTYGGAFAARCEKERGRLGEGQLADFVILSDDPTGILPEEWNDRVKVELTAVGGEPVFGEWDAVAS